MTCYSFLEPSFYEANNVKDIMAVYEKASGQSINFQKFGISFSPNTSSEVKDAIRSIFGVL